MSFSDIIGHQNIIIQLKEFIKINYIPNSIIFYGKEGIGKFKIAIEFAKAINCLKGKEAQSLFSSDPGDKNNTDSCDKCISCNQIKNNSHPDVHIIDYKFQANLKEEDIEKQKTIKIDTIREMIKISNTKPILSIKKIFIINDADTMTIEAQNAILKLIEEPSENNLIILIVSNKNAMLPTILSRCQIIRFNPLLNKDIEKILGNLDIDYKEAALLANLCGGSVKKALDFKKIRQLIKENCSIKELSPFLITSALGKELYEIRENVHLLIEYLISDLYYKKLIFENPKKLKEIIFLIKKNLQYLNFIDRYVSPKIISQLAIIDYNHYFNINEI